MPRCSSHKLKIIRLAQILYTKTDQDHPMTVAELLQELDALGIHAERKSIYDDLDALRTAGMDIIQIKGRCAGYYVGSRLFEPAELKLLCDSVQSSQFITRKKTESMIRKIGNLTSVHEARGLARQVYVTGRVKSMNESVFYNVDELSHAINENRMIRFQYQEYSLNKEQKLRRNGRFYEESPYALIWDSDRYYLLAWDDKAAMFKHFRVDKMLNIFPLPKERSGREAFARLDLAHYGRMVFGMFTGEDRLVTLRFRSSLVNPVLDHFGRDVALIPDGEEHFLISTSVVISPKFYAWLFSFGDGAEVISPADVRGEMAGQLRAAAKIYGE